MWLFRKYIRWVFGTDNTLVRNLLLMNGTTTYCVLGLAVGVGGIIILLHQAMPQPQQAIMIGLCGYVIVHCIRGLYRNHLK